MATTERRGRPAAPRLSEAFDPRRNSLNFLRLLFAFLVLYAHSYSIYGLEGDPLGRWHGYDFGDIAVDGFFVISGFLITRSLLVGRSLPRYLWHRFLRIFPGVWVCLLVTALVFGPIAWLHDRPSLTGYWASGPESAYGYVARNVTLFVRQWGIHGLLDGQPLPAAFNGSLWTLIYEFACYLGLALLAVVGVLRRSRRAVLLLTGGVWLLYVAERAGALPQSTTLTSAVRFTGIFLVGTVFFLYSDRIHLSRRAALAATVVYGVSLTLPDYRPLGIVPFAYVVMWLAVYLPLERVGQRTDLSYGVYVYAFPIQQTLFLYGVRPFGLIGYIALTAVLSAAAAFASWHLVEHPALSLKSWTPRRRRAAGPVGPPPEEARVPVYSRD